MMIAETSPRYVTSSGPWEHWFAPVLSFIADRPAVKAACYISWGWRRWPRWKDWGDCRIDREPAVLARWRDSLRQGWWIHADEQGSANLEQRSA